MSSKNTPRVSQRQPKACQECTRRKIRCDKKYPCTRCVKRSIACTREVVRISKAETVHRDEIGFLRFLSQELEDSGDIGAAILSIQQRLQLLEHGDLGSQGSQDKARFLTENDLLSPSSTFAPTSAMASLDEFAEHSELPDLPDLPEDPSTQSPATPLPSSLADGSTVFGSVHVPHNINSSPNKNPDQRECASKIRTVEFLAWGRHTGTCFPHRSDCRCRSFRPYAEIASINADPNWAGIRRVHIPFTSAQQQHQQYLIPSVLQLLSAEQAKILVHFHLDHILWHHNVFHGPTFLAQCDEFWSAGTVHHPLWMALYLSVLSVSIWTVLNCEPLPFQFFADESIVYRFFRAMIQTLYDENFLENLSLFSIQAIVLSTRIAHNLDMSDLNAAFVGAAIRIAHCLGIHQIKGNKDLLSTAVAEDWYESVETEVGRQCWLQLVIQDWFQTPFTQTYLISPSHFSTEMPRNCHDEDMITRNDQTPTINSYIRVLARIASLIPALQDGLEPAKTRHSLIEVHEHIIASHKAFLALVKDIPDFFLQGHQQQSDTSPPPFTAADNERGNRASMPAWLPVARRSLAISAADKIIMIHRPILFHSFQIPIFSRSRAICVAAAMTILREHEAVSKDGNAISLWTHSAFCVTATMVIGLELLFREVHIDDEARRLRGALAGTATRLKDRKCDRIAERGAALIETMLEAEEQLVLEVMRQSLSGSSIKATQLELANKVVESNEILAKFLAMRPDSKKRQEALLQSCFQAGSSLHTPNWPVDGSFISDQEQDVDFWLQQMSSTWNTFIE